MASGVPVRPSSERKINESGHRRNTEDRRDHASQGVANAGGKKQDHVAEVEQRSVVGRVVAEVLAVDDVVGLFGVDGLVVVVDAVAQVEETQTGGNGQDQDIEQPLAARPAEPGRARQPAANGGSTSAHGAGRTWKIVVAP